MPNLKTKVSFKGTKEQEKELVDFIRAHSQDKGSMMPILQKAQEMYGYIPEEVQIIIAEETGVPLSEIYGIVSFYSQFTLNPKGKYQISVCLGTACYVKGAGDILDKVCEIIGCESGSITDDGMFSVDATRCIGACGLAPVFTVNESVYGRVDVAETEQIIKKYVAEAKGS
ncbi:MAG: NAD(P)H-dependent oxidoreductase subunit E [Clostridiales bacterium]|jgi:NADP-reducing hydrogenase subunit HndA|nr:NAD(P)H-dependent oxidoreductase subunit E [Clostridiales bacterium]